MPLKVALSITTMVLAVDEVLVRILISGFQTFFVGSFHMCLQNQWW